MTLNLLHLATPSLRDQHRDLRVAHNSLLAAHARVHGSLDLMPESTDGIIASLKGLDLSRPDLEHRATSLPEQVTRLRAALAHAQQQYASAQETVTAYLNVYGTPDDRVAPMIETLADLWRTLGYIGRSLRGYEVRVAAHAQACALLATRL